MARATDTFQVSGVRCERCVMRLATALEDQPGLESAHANLMGEVTLAWDDEITSRAALAGVLAGAGFHERPAAQSDTERTRPGIAAPSAPFTFP